MLDRTAKTLLRLYEEDRDSERFIAAAVKKLKFYKKATWESWKQYEGEARTPWLGAHLAIRWSANSIYLKSDIPVMRQPPVGPQEEKANVIIVRHDPLEFLVLSGSQAGYLANAKYQDTSVYKALAKLKDVVIRDAVGMKALAKITWEQYKPVVTWFTVTDKMRARNRKLVNYRLKKRLRPGDACAEWSRIGHCYNCPRGVLPPNEILMTERHTCQYAMNKFYTGDWRNEK